MAAMGGLNLGPEHPDIAKQPTYDMVQSEVLNLDAIIGVPLRTFPSHSLELYFCSATQTCHITTLLVDDGAAADGSRPTDAVKPEVDDDQAEVSACLIDMLIIPPA